MAAPILGLTLELVAGTPTPIPAGQPFTMRLTYECSSSMPGDQCENMVVTSTLPPELEGVAVVGNSDIELVEYDEATRTATWQFNSVLPLGTTGQLEFEVRYLPGITPDGTQNQIVAEIVADGATPYTTNPITITSDSEDKSTVTKIVASGGASGDLTTYRISVCPGNFGALDLTNATIVDTLPAGAVYVSSVPPASSIDVISGTQTITWSGVDVEVPDCEIFEVTVNFPTSDPSNALGGIKNNQVSVTGTPFGLGAVTKNANINHTLVAPNPGFALTKRADGDTIIGGTVQTRLQVQNSGNVQLNNVVVTDPIPPEYDVTEIDTGLAVAVSYQKNGEPTWISGVPLGSEVEVSSFPSFVAGDYISNLRFEMGSIPVAFNNSQIQITSTVINPPHASGSSYSLPHNITNTATMTGESVIGPLTTSVSSATTEVDVPKARPIPQKEILSGNPALPGQIISYRLTLGNGNFEPLDEPVFGDLMPAELEYVPGSWELASNIPGCIVQPTFTSTPDVGGSGRTLLSWSWAGSNCSIASGEQLSIELEAKVKAGTYPSTLPNRSVLLNYATPVNLVRKSNCVNAPSSEINLLTGAGYDSNKLCFSDPSNLLIKAAASISSAKLVKGQLDSRFARDPEIGQTVQSGLITYQMVLTNTGNVDFRDLQIVDVLPFNDPAPGNLGVRDLAVLGTAWTPQLAGPVTITPAIPGLTIRYSTETNPCRPALAPSNPGCIPMTNGVEPGLGIWSLNLPHDPTTVRSVLFDFGSYQLKANEAVQFTFPMFAPDDAPPAAAGPDGQLGTNDDTNIAWNTFAYSATRADDGSQLVAQPPRVGIEVQAPPSTLASYGNYVWNDVNQNGIQDEPAYRGLNGITVNLYKDADGNPATTNDQTLVGTQITRNDSSGNPGYYLFTALEPGHYFASFTPPTDFVVTDQDEGGNDALDSDIDPTTRRTAITELVANEQDLSWDAGFHAPEIEIGNRIWFDTNNDSLDNDGTGAVAGSSSGIEGVSLELFLDVNGDGKITGSELYPFATVTTDANGYYNFDRQTHQAGVALPSPVALYPGQYIVGIPASNFAAGGPLAGYHSSGTTISNAGVISEAEAAAITNDSDRDDNGMFVRTAGAFYEGGVLTKPLFVGYTEPLNEGAPDPRGTTLTGDTIADNASNLTVDFGFYTTSIGNLVWDDNGAGGGTIANGVRDGSEPGVAGVSVRLYSSNGTQILTGPDGILGTADDGTDALVTDASGNYQFSGLPQGEYVVRISTPTGYVSTRDVGTTSSPSNNVDSDDNGIGSGSGTVSSNAVTMTPGAAGTINNNVVSTGSGSTYNPTVDFGIIRNYSLGNRVWRDDNNSGTIDNGEVGISGVSVRLYLSDGVTRATNIAGSQVADVTTNAQGYYRFDNLPAGDYIVEILGSNLIDSGALVGTRSSTGAGNTYEPAQDPDDNIDNDDNGSLSGAVVRSGVVSLGDGDGISEPTNDNDKPSNGDGAQNNQSNLTVDFGFYPLYSLGNRVWDDLDNNGSINGSEAGIDGVTVRLYNDANTDGTPDGAAIATTTTANGGYYLFEELLSGTYIVEIVPPAGYQSSRGDFSAYEPAPDPDTVATDNDDNGTTVGAVIRSAAVTLGWQSEPTGEPATPGYSDAARDNNANYTVDFGIYRPLSLGNLVWMDDDNNGIVNGSEAGIPGVTVRLYRDNNGDGVPDDLNGGGVTTADAIRSMVTNADGSYLFTDLGQGDYIVELDTPVGLTSSTGRTLPTSYEPAPDPDDNEDHDDNGTRSGSVIRSAPVTLTLGTEPINEPATPGLFDTTPDANANYTVDFGLYPSLSLGNRVWFDQNNDGRDNNNEPGINASTVRLYRDDNSDGIPDDLNASGDVTTADAIATTSTNTNGYYLFTGLSAGNYIVEVVAPTGWRSSTGVQNPTGPYEAAPDPDDNEDRDDNGTHTSVPNIIRSATVTLTVDGEPTGEPTTPGISDSTADNRSNLTVDFGLFLPVNLGNLIFEDVDANGFYDSAVDRVMPGATVSLTYADGSAVTDINGTAVASQTTGADGLYGFNNLFPGDYRVTVTAPSGFISTTDTANTNNPNNLNTDNDDNGPGSTNSVTSGILTVTPGQEPNTDGDGSSGNLTLDFGFYHPVRLGNLIFEDRDNDARYDSAIDTPLAGAIVELFAADGSTAVTDINGNPVGPQTTTSTGLYLFDNLVPGNYVVRVTGPNGYFSSTDITSSASTNNDINNDDNGIGGGNIVSSAAVTLNSSGEPLSAVDSDDNQGNLTVDFGFYRPMRLGNFVFEDIENNGIYDGDDAPIAGAVVALFLADGTTPAVHPDGTPVASQTTGADGLYLFDNLPPGEYRVQVSLPVGYHSSSDIGSSANPNNNTDNDDNGIGSSNVAMSNAIELIMVSEPTNDGDDNQGNLTVDFGFYQSMRLGDLVFEDGANNGIFDGDDTPIQGAVVELFLADGTTPAVDINGATVASQTTGADGLYLFDNLPPGEYRVRVTAPAGYRSSTDISSSANPDNDINNDDNGIGSANSVLSNVVTLESGKEPTTDGDGTNGNLSIDFGFFQPVNLGNQIFIDVNNNGIYEPATDQPMPGAVVTLLPATGTGTVKDADGNDVGPITTGPDGLYNFTNLLPGEYRVQVEAAGNPAYRSSSDIASTADPDNNTNNDDNGIGETNLVVSEIVTLTSGGEPTNEGDGHDGNLSVDFGFFLPVNVGNFVFVDLENDGLYNGTDYPLTGAVVSITTASGDPVIDIDGNTVGSITTTSTGLYAFENLYPGQYIISVTAPTGYSSSSDIASQTADPNSNIDNDDNGIGVGNSASTGIITLTNNGEPATAVDGDGTNGNLTIDFGFYQTVRLGNLIFEDKANNGVFDAGSDTPLAGALVELFLADGTTPAVHPDGTPVASQTTGSDGLYLFDNLMPGDYVVRVSAPSGFISSTDIVSTPNTNANIDNDDNGVGSSNVVSSIAITLVSQGEPDTATDGDDTNGNLTVDFGFFHPLSLGNLIFEDMANNGVFDAGTDTPLAGALVELFMGDGSTPALDVNGNPVTSQTTTSTGEYLFNNLPPGQYVVRVTAPSAYVSSSDISSSATPDNNTDNDDNGIGNTNQVYSNPITLTSGDEPDTAADGDGTNGNLTVDFGFYIPAQLGDIVWLDSNRDGVQDTGELGVPGVTVTLYTPGPDGLVGTADDVLVDTQTTAGDGSYLFDNLPAGQYYVEFDLPTGYERSPQNSASGTASSDSDADLTTGRTAIIDLSSGEDDRTWDAGIYYNASLGDRVWLDANGNGVQDAGEQGVPNVTVTLYTSTGTLVNTTVTDANGNYGFNHVPPGDYYVEFDIPSGYTVTTQDVGSNDQADSDVDPTTGRTIVTTISLGEHDPSWDLGLYLPVSLGNLVWNDVNNNGIVDGSESGIDGVVVNLYLDRNQNGVIDPSEQVGTTTTSAGGLYLFDNLMPGQYIVQLDQSNFASGAPLEGYISSTGSVGTHINATGSYETAPNGDTDINNDDNGTTKSGQGILATGITLTSNGEPINDGDSDPNSNLSIDFGVFKPASLGSYVWYDLDKDGVRDAGEAGVPNVTVTLYNAAGTPVATTTTNSSGFYQFINLPPGTYSVGFSNLPAGYEFTSQHQGGDPAIDSDVSPKTGLTQQVTLAPGQNDPTLYAGIHAMTPTAVNLLRFNASVATTGITINWVTAAEQNSYGFLIYRSENGQRAEAVQISPSLIASKGSSSAGASYSWTDTTAQAGKSYNYWLVEVELNQNSNWYGPVKAQSQTSSSFTIHLPLVTK